LFIPHNASNIAANPAAPHPKHDAQWPEPQEDMGNPAAPANTPIMVVFSLSL